MILKNLNMIMGLPDEYWDYIYKEFKKFDKENSEETSDVSQPVRNPLFEGLPSEVEAYKMIRLIRAEIRTVKTILGKSSVKGAPNPI